MKTFIKKICMCGDPAVGKTSLVRRFVTGKYSPKYITTLGTVISQKAVEFPDKDLLMKMQVWDISGQAEFKRIHKSAFRYSEAAFIVCDILRPETAESVETWMSNLFQYSDFKIPVIVLVNKYDHIQKKQKNMQQIRKTLEKLNCPIFTTSAKTGQNVEQSFEVLAKRLIPTEKQLPRTAEELVSMPELFENPYDLLDYVLVRYSTTFGDQEMSLHLIRHQLETGGKAFSQEPREETMKMINKLSDIMMNFKGYKEGQQLRAEFMEAYKRCHF